MYSAISDASPSAAMRSVGVPSAMPEKGLSLKEMERELIQRTLEKCGGNKSVAAEILGISRKALYEKMSRLGIGKK